MGDEAVGADDRPGLRANISAIEIAVLAVIALILAVSVSAVLWLLLSNRLLSGDGMPISVIQ